MFIRTSLIFITLITIGCGKKTIKETNYSQFSLSNGPSSTQDDFLIGAGKADITGPVVGLETMGYAAPTPVGAGLQQRLWARAFIIADSTNPNQRVVHVTTDLCFVAQAQKIAVVERLREEFGNLYSFANVMLTATHTHSAPGGLSHHVYYNIPSLGSSPRNHQIVVDGIVDAIRKAHATLTPGSIQMTNSTLLGANINRSELAYEQNPSFERSRHVNSTDKSVTMLKFVSEENGPIGLLHWFGVHAVSLEKDNTLISGDNKGYAAWATEKAMNNQDFVAAFANTNAGDSTPNVDRDVDGDGDWECSANENFACAKSSGEKHAQSALEMFNEVGTNLSGPINFKHRFVDFSNVTVRPEFSGESSNVKTCSPAIGLAMWAGSEEDGPGVLAEGQACGGDSRLANVICKIDMDPCHGKKAVVLPVGQFDPPWVPEVIPTQIFRIGSLAILGVPAEVTTMSGRRLRETVKAVLGQLGVTKVIVNGYANAFTQYLTTREEYQIQHYEGGSTVFGEHSLGAYRQNFHELATAIVNNSELEFGPSPHFLDEPGVVNDGITDKDTKRRGVNYGDKITEVKSTYIKGDLVKLTVVGSNPNANLRHNGSFWNVEKYEEDDNTWRVYANDGDWSTKMSWRKTSILFGLDSEITYTWEIPSDTPTGKYRITFSGKANDKNNGFVDYSGTSKNFVIQ